MTDFTVEFFTDPFSPWCWQCEPITRKLRFRYGDHLTWIPRMTVSISETQQIEHPSTETEEGEDADHLWTGSINGPSLPVVESVWQDDPPISSRRACHAVSAVRERYPRRAELLLRHIREAVFASGEPPGTDEDIEKLLQKTGLDASSLHESGALTEDVERARYVASELDEGVAIDGPIDTMQIGSRLEEGDDDPALMIVPPSLRIERQSEVVVVDPRQGLKSLEGTLRRLHPTLQSSQVGQMEQLIDSVAKRTTPEIAEEFGQENIKSNIKKFMQRFERAFLTEVSFGVDASNDRTRRILSELQSASIVRPILGKELHAWRWAESHG